MHLQLGVPYLLFPKPKDLVFDATQHMHAVVGIGYPERFFESLKQLGIRNFTEHAFADHHAYQRSDLQFAEDRAIITTEKDAVKLKALWPDAALAPVIWVLPVKACLSPACYQLLQQQLQSLGVLYASEPSP